MPDPQHDPAAEKAVLGSVISSPKALDAVAPLLRPEDFYSPANEVLWEVITGLHEAGQPVTMITVKDALTTTGRLAQVGGLPYLAELATQGLSPATAPAHARIVANKATLRRLETAGTRVTQIARTGEMHPAELANLAAAEVASAYRPSGEGKKTHIADLIGDVLDELESSEDETGLTWPYIDANRILRPMKPGQFIIFGGGPGMGKSVAMNEVARHTAMHLGKRTVIHSLEMGYREIIKRIIAAEARVHLSALLKGNLTEDQWARVGAATARLTASPLYIDDSPHMGITELRASIKKHTPDIVLFDYIQLGAIDGKADRRIGLENFSRDVKRLAKETGIVMVSAAQLGREVEKRTDHIPMLSDLREAGGLERDADIVILLNRPDYYEKECPRAGEIDLIVAKQRDGETGTVPLAHQLHFSRFADLAA